MSTIIQGDQLRGIALGRGPESKATGALTHNGVKTLFTVAGGEVLITALWAVVTTTMAGANTLNLQVNPTTGDTIVVVTATDLGTTDTTAGTVIGINDQTDGAPDYLRGGKALTNLVVSTGTVEALGTGSGTIDGALTFYCTWVPLTAGATLVAA